MDTKKKLIENEFCWRIIWLIRKSPKITNRLREMLFFLI
jgi:hypothetical protein